MRDVLRPAHHAAALAQGGIAGRADPPTSDAPVTVAASPAGAAITA